MEVLDGTVCPSALQLPSDRCGNVPISTHKHAHSCTDIAFYFIHSLHYYDPENEIRSSDEHSREFWVFFPASRGYLKGPVYDEGLLMMQLTGNGRNYFAMFGRHEAFKREKKPQIPATSATLKAP